MKTPNLNMRFTPRATPVCLVLLLACTAGYGQTCESIQAQVDSKIKAAGVANFTLTVMDAGVETKGKIVGTCDRGSKKIVYAQSSPTGRPVKPGNDAILTECKDGSVSYGGDCKK